MLFFVNSSDGSASNVNDATTGDNASDSNDGQRPSTGNYDNIFSEINFTKLTTQCISNYFSYFLFTNIIQLLDDILKREPVEPARSAKQLFTSEWLAKHKKKKQSDAKEAWKSLDKKEKKKWHEKLEPQRQKYIEDYTVFVRGLDKEELEMYTELKQKRDEEEEGQNDSSDSESDSSESDESDSDSESDSDI